MLKEDSVQIYQTLENWKKTRGIVKNIEIKPDGKFESWITFNNLSDNEKRQYDKSIYFNGLEYEIILINKNSKIVIYEIDNINDSVINTRYIIYYDSITKQVISKAIDIYGLYPNPIPLADGNLQVLCGNETASTILAKEMRKYNPE